MTTRFKIFLVATALLLLAPSREIVAEPETRIWLLVIGISDYQYLGDLKYADDDALAFYEFARRSLGDRIQSDQMKLLLNQDATFSEIRISFEWLLRNVDENDRVYLYFSGHGGHEDMTVSKLGYLHAYDSHDATYNNGGNIDLNLLDNILKTFSQRGAETFLFLDACHAGKIVEDDYLFLNNSLATQIPNIVKFLSAQGEESSYEHSKWGGGHGVFTFYLLEGILGHADDSPRNKVVSIYELEKYLIDKVPRDTDYGQIPIVIASNKRKYVFPTIDQSFNHDEDAAATISSLKEISGRDASLAGLDLEDEEIASFRIFLSQYDLLKDDVDLLFFEFEKRRQTINDEEKQNQLLDHLIAEVLSSSQFYINIVIGAYEGDPVRLNYSDAKYRIYDALTRTLATLDAGYPGYKLLLTRRIFFDSEKDHDGFHQGIVSKSQIKKTIENLYYAIELDPNATYLKNQVGVLSWHINDYAVAEAYLLQAAKYSPKWSFPDVGLGNVYWDIKKYNLSLKHYHLAMTKKPQVASIYNNISDNFRLTAGKSTEPLSIRLNYDSAIFYLSKGSELMDSTHSAKNFEGIANIYEDEFKLFGDELYLSKAITNYKKALLFSADNFQGIAAALGHHYSVLDPESGDTFFYDGVVTSYDNMEAALVKFRNAFENGFSDWQMVDVLPAFILENRDFIVLVEKSN